MRPIGALCETIIAGKIVKCKSNTLTIKITDGIDVVFANILQSFEINFFINRLPYICMHNALQWFQQHKLHGILINNAKFNEGYTSNRCGVNSYNFSCDISNKLNEEQKIAIHYMLKVQETPFILHGPPGKQKMNFKLPIVILDIPFF